MLLGHMRIKIPWKNLSTEQTVIELEGVYVIIVPYLSTLVAFVVSFWYTGCLQLLEISWNLIGPPGNFCVRCRRSTAFAIRCFFQVPDAPKPFFMRLRPRPLWRSLWRSSKFLFGWGELKYSYYEYFSSPKEAEARQTCPGFFLKSLLESPRNLLEICLIKFVDTLVQCHHIHLLYREVPTQCFALFKQHSVFLVFVAQK